MLAVCVKIGSSNTPLVFIPTLRFRHEHLTFEEEMDISTLVYQLPYLNDLDFRPALTLKCTPTHELLICVLPLYTLACCRLCSYCVSSCFLHLHTTLLGLVHTHCSLSLSLSVSHCHTHQPPALLAVTPINLFAELPSMIIGCASTWLFSVACIIYPAFSVPSKRLHST